MWGPLNNKYNSIQNHMQWNLSTLTHQGPGECVRLYRMSEPVYSWHTKDQGNVSDCTGCQNPSTLYTPRTRGMCQIVQDVRTCLLLTHQGPGKCIRLYRMSEPVYSDTPRTKGMCQIVQDVRTCIFWHTKDQGNVTDCTGCQNLYTLTHQGPGECVRLYRMSQYSGFTLVNRNTLGL